MKPKVPLSLRFAPELERRLEDCAVRLKIKKHTLAQMAIEAAVEAIEKNGYRIVMPIQFDATHTAVKRSKEQAEFETGPMHDDERSLMEDQPVKKKTA